MKRAIDKFHQLHPATKLELDVTRHPYSFSGARKTSPDIHTWREGLHNGGWGGEAAVRSISHAGKEAGITFEFAVPTHYQPVDSQRLLKWAARQGMQEDLVDAMGHQYFERCKGVVHREALLQAVDEAGLDVKAAAAFLDTDELSNVVWQSYGDTLKRGIHSIPQFSFSHAADSEGITVSGSGNMQMFLNVFEQIFVDTATSA